MRRAKYHQDSQVNEDGSDDSFLDVVANVVGVLIILVMLVGAQATRSVWVAASDATPLNEIEELPSHEPEHDLDQLRDELQKAHQSALAAERSIRDIALQVTKINHESQAYDQQRVELAMHRSLLEEDLQRRKQQLDESQQVEFDVQRQLLESKLDLDKLTQEQLSLIDAPNTVTEVECVPTPLARVVEGKSIHLRLSRGLVSVVPFENLMDEVQTNISDTLQRLQQRGKTVDTYGPQDGYRLKLTMARRSSPGSASGPFVGRTQRVSVGWEAEIIPVSAEIGQNVEQSLLPGGVLYRHLLQQQREKPAVVVWLYTDSFDEFRPLKRALWEMGFALATRPMTPGTNIKASPHGTRAAAQ